MRQCQNAKIRGQIHGMFDLMDKFLTDWLQLKVNNCNFYKGYL